MHRIKFRMIQLTTCLAFSFAFSSLLQAAVLTFPPAEEGRERRSYEAVGKNGAIAAAHPLASQAGITMLRKGGNAADAAVAVSFVISVVRPHSTGIGGGGFLLYHPVKTGGVKIYDFRERAPIKATADMYLDEKGEPKAFAYQGKTLENASVHGHLAVGTPGLVKGLLEFHGEHGRLPLAVVMQPAIEAAEKGFLIYPSLAAAIAKLEDTLRIFPGSRKIFLPKGKPLLEGETLVQADLAKTLQQIVKHGVAGFYSGEVGAAIVAEMKNGGGLVSKADLSSYAVKKREPVTGSYRGYQIVSMPPPSSGGVHIVQMANMLAQYDLKKWDHDDPSRLHLLAEVMRRAFADRAEYLGDPDFVEVPIKGLISEEYAQALVKTIEHTKASSSLKIGAGDPAAYESPSTTHLSVVDSEGNAVSSTQTINTWFGSGVVVQGTGIVLNNEMDDFSKKPGTPNAFGLVGSKANAIAARKTMLSSMSPTMVFDDKKRLHMVVGSPGGPRIITATLQAILGVIDHQLSLPDAVHALRIHHQWLPDQLYIEEGYGPKVEEQLQKRGHKMESTSSIGDVQAIIRVKDGWQAVSDTRSEGQPRAY